jgi:hypothetical protein
MNEAPTLLTDGGASEYSLDALFEALSAERRRYAMYCVSDCDGYIERHEVARVVGGWELNCAPSEVPEETFKRLLSELHHTHLPKLSDAGLVDYDLRTGDVSPTAALAGADDYLRLARRDDGVPP